MGVSGEMIGRSIARMRKNLISIGPGHQLPAWAERDIRESFKRMEYGVVVDVTPVNDDWKNDGAGYSPFDPNVVMLPPHDEVTFCFVDNNDDIDVINIIGASTYLAGTEEFDHYRGRMEGIPIEGDPANGPSELNWDEVKWITATALFLDAPGSPNVVGPVMSWRMAIDENGKVLDLQFIAPGNGKDPHTWDYTIAVYMKAVTWLNCRNIELAVPKRSNPERKRIARTGTEVQTIHIRPIGKTVQGRERTELGAGVPLSAVRGHMAEYGMNGRGKLFGKYTGRFWIPAHVRGSAELGESNPTRVLEPS